MKCLIPYCNYKSERHHIKSRGSGGCDSDFNILTLCRNHHIEIHSIGPVRFCEKYTDIKFILLEKGWEIVDIFGIKKLRR